MVLQPAIAGKYGLFSVETNRMKVTTNEKMAEKAIAKQFGKLVAVLRVKKRFTQDGFAYHAGINRSYYGEIERGEVSVSVYKADLIAKGLSLELGELMVLLDKERKKEPGKEQLPGK